MGLAEIKARLAAQKASAPAQSTVQPAQAPAQTKPAPAQAPAPVQRNLIQAQEKNLPSASELDRNVQELQESLLARHPRMPTLLREIHTALRLQPENVTLLTEDQISVIVNGLKIQTGVEFAAISTKSSSKGIKAKIAAQGVDAF
jgi:hypothetical protein